MIQLDFIKQGQTEPMYWLINLHSYKLHEESLNFVQRFGPFNSVAKLKITAGEQTTPMKCTLCWLKYKRGEVEKRLPMKMLIDLKNHLKKRRIYIFPDNQIVAEEFLMHTCRVCTLCYQLIVQESQLIEVLFCDSSSYNKL